MHSVNAFTKKMIESAITFSLNGTPRGMGVLARLGGAVAGPGTRAFFARFAQDARDGTGFAPLFCRAGTLANTVAKRRLVRNLICNWGIDGPRIRAELSARGIHAPSFIVISPSMKCNLRCTGCYSGLYEKDGELTEEEVDRTLAEARSFGSYFVVVSGGEPYCRRDMWLRLFRRYSDMYFMTYTNGTLLDQATVDELARLGNVAPAISIEGYRAETDERRGVGVYDKVRAAMRRLHAAGVIFGISVTYTSRNVETVATEEFLQHAIDAGALFAWYFMFMPVGKDPCLDLVPTPEQRRECGERVAELRTRLPIFAADFWNDGPAVGGCLAGGRLYLHVVSSGRVEPCVFAHFGVDTIREKTLLEAANSPFFCSIRERFPYNEAGNLRRPCMIMDNPEVLRDAVAEHVVPQGHEHSEDIIRDPQVVSFIDDYAARFAALMDPVWAREIADPNSRWYRNGLEYRSLWDRHVNGRSHPPIAAEQPEREPVPR